MIARFHQPGPPLQPFVDCLWHFQGYSVTHTRERALPTGTIEVVFNLGEERARIFHDDADLDGQEFRESVVCGPQSSYFVLDTSRPGTVLGIHFRPGGATPFLGFPSHELTDRHVALEDIWGPNARQLRAQLVEAASPTAMFALLERALVARLTRPPLIHPAVALALHQLNTMPAVARIRDVQGETGYSPKYFIDLFRNSVGLTPKLYCRIQRFQTVINQLANNRRVEWALVALDSGYSDQPHLNREFRAFSGVTPGEYRPVADDRPSHVAID
jgi:AraC-like DNA-binding protein